MCENAKMRRKTSDLERWRKAIETSDERLLSALSKRTEIVRKIGAYKCVHGLPVLDAKRKQALERKWVATGATRGLPKEFVKDLFARIHAFSISVEKKSGV